MGTRLAVVLVFAAACAGRDGPALDGQERFAGEWMVDQPFHAGYEASWYFFHDAGVLEHLRDCAFGGSAPTGVVSDASEQVRCEFGARWSALASDTLVIAGECNDGRDRDIVLGFPRDTTGNATGVATIEILAVGGEDGWVHPEFDWNWQKCGEDSCAPALSDVDCP